MAGRPVRFKDRSVPVDTYRMMRRASTAELIAAEFAGAVASGHYDRAEGWLAVARLEAARADDLAPSHSHRSTVRSDRSSAVPAR